MEDIIVNGFLRRYKETSSRLQKPVRIERIFEPIWNYLSVNEKRSLGKNFYNAVAHQRISGVTFAKKNAAGRIYYRIF
jgi:hypothetical protein